MSFARLRPGAWVLSAGLAAACGDSFTSANGSGADGSGNSSALGGQAGGKSTDASTSSGGSAGSSSGGSAGSAKGGTAGSTTGGTGGAGTGGSAGSAMGGTAGVSRGGSAGSVTGGTAGKGGTGGSGGTAGSSMGAGGSVSGQGGVGGSAGSKGAGGGVSGSSGDAGPDANQCQLCTDLSCARLRWSFDSGTLEGITSLDPLAVRSFMGSFALAVDVAELNAGEIQLSLPICLGGAIDIRSRTFTFRVYFDGAPASSGELYLQASSPSPQSTAYLGYLGPNTGVWNNFSAPMSMSAFSASATKITIQLGSTGAPFGGTVWFDDFRIQ